MSETPGVLIRPTAQGIRFRRSPITLLGDATHRRCLYSPDPPPPRCWHIPQMIHSATGVGIAYGRPLVLSHLFQYAWLRWRHAVIRHLRAWSSCVGPCISRFLPRGTKLRNSGWCPEDALSAYPYGWPTR